MLSVGKFVSALSLGLVVASSASGATVIAGWNITTAFPTGTGNVPTGQNYSVGAADVGAQTAGSNLRAFHTLAATTYVSPSGNGSQYAFSSTNWSPGDFYEARFSTAGFSGISISWDQARSSTGPAQFKLFVGFDGSNFTEVLSYTVLQSGGGGAPGTWNSTTYNALYATSFAFDASVNDRALVFVRFQNAETTTSASGGSNRIDNVFVMGASTSAIPLPGAAGLAACGLLGMSRRRRR